MPTDKLSKHRTVTVYLARCEVPLITISKADAEEAEATRSRYSDWADGGDPDGSPVLELTDDGGRQHVVPFASIAALVIA